MTFNRTHQTGKVTDDQEAMTFNRTHQNGKVTDDQEAMTLNRTHQTLVPTDDLSLSGGNTIKNSDETPADVRRTIVLEAPSGKAYQVGAYGHTVLSECRQLQC
jgi:hypothetical protein